MINLSEEQFKELIKCYNDPIYFIENYTWIEVKEESKIVPTVLFEKQRIILKWLINRENILVLKSRRVGGSTIVALYLAWLLNFRKGVNALLLSRNEDAAKKLLAKVKFSMMNIKKHTTNNFALADDASWMLNPIPVNAQQFLKVGWQNDEGDYVSFGEIYSLTTTKESGRGDSATFIFMDELAFLPDQEESMRAARLTVTRGGHWMAVSTANGVGDVFHSMCMAAERKENKHYKFLRFHWSEAGMDELMIERATEGLSDSSRNQEMEMEFISSGDPVFNAMHLAACYKPIEDYPEIGLEILEYQKKHKNNPDEYFYYSGVDTAMGKLSTKSSKRDYHSFTSLTKSGIQVHSYHSKTDSLTDWAGNIEQLPNNIQVRREGIVSKLHAKYPGLLSIEINGPGQTVWMNHKLPNDGFSNIIIKHTNLKTKDQLIRQLILAIESHSIIITDKFTYQCLIVYQRGSTPGTYSAPLGDYYDDPVISLALAWDILLQNGAMDFSWGSGTDNLVRDRLADEDILANDLLNLGYGPSILLKQDSGERLSNYGPDNILIPDSDLDISRLNEPEFMKWI